MIPDIPSQKQKSFRDRIIVENLYDLDLFLNFINDELEKRILFLRNQNRFVRLIGKDFICRFSEIYTAKACTVKFVYQDACTMKICSNEKTPF